MATDTKAKKDEDLLAKLIIPTNPEYDWTGDVEQTEYVNPVTLNNREVQYANAAIVTTQHTVTVNRKIADLKHQLQLAEFAVEDFERDLLLRFPPPAQSTKNNKLLAVYIAGTATQQGMDKQHNTLITKVRDLRRDLLRWEAEADNCHAVFQAIKLAGEHVQTHLSFVKSEQRNAKAY